LSCNFRYSEYEAMLLNLIEAGYVFVTLREFFSGRAAAYPKVVVNRIDVDQRVDRLRVLRPIYHRLGVRASIFVRLHAAGYNLLNFGTLRFLRELSSDGHEIGLHTELIDGEGIIGVDGAQLLTTELQLLQTVLGASVHGTASHGDMTGFNNLHFWRRYSPADFGLLYEAYDSRLWQHCRYVSDSEWIRWKAYDKGKLLEGDLRTPQQHARDDAPSLLYLLSHPESWYEHYIYE
jgi:hypothetical protein